LDIYNVIEDIYEEEGDYIGTPVKLTVIYYRNGINDFVIQRMKDIFS
jgi:hypothetical protein